MADKEEMLEYQLKKRGIVNPAVLKAMETIERANFLPKGVKQHAYEDGPLPIGKGQTISQPYIVAFMAQALDLKPDSVVLEVGAGCGYSAAVLSQIASKVYSIEIIEWLARVAEKNLDNEKIQNAFVRRGDGYKGWPAKAPFDAITLAAAPSEIPEPLKEQLKIGGKLLAPVGTIRQELTLLEKIGERKFRQKSLMPVRFVPMTGQAQKSSSSKGADIVGGAEEANP